MQTETSDDVLLTSEQVTTFVTRGYLRFDAVVPADLNLLALREMHASFERWRMIQTALAFRTAPTAGVDALPELVSFGTPLADAFDDNSAYGRFLRIPQVAGAIRSLVGSHPIVTDHFAHVIPPRRGVAQRLHSDTPLGLADEFAIQLFWYPHDVADGAGGTRFIPGSHLRQLRHEEIGRYMHLLGEECFVGLAGTVAILHHGLWHAASENHSDEHRVMGKLRLNPTEPQVLLWDAADLTPCGGPDIIDRVIEVLEAEPGEHLRTPEGDDLARRLASILRERQPWHDSTSQYDEVTKRAHLWRALCGRA